MALAHVPNLGCQVVLHSFFCEERVATHVQGSRYGEKVVIEIIPPEYVRVIGDTRATIRRPSAIEHRLFKIDAELLLGQHHSQRTL